MRVSREQWQEWQDNPVTQAVRAHLEEYRAALDAAWQNAMRSQTDLTNPSIQHFHAACMGKDEVIDDILELKYEDVEGEHDQAA